MVSPFKDRTGFLFISGGVRNRVPIFRYRNACEIFLRTLEAYRQKYGFFVHAFALMPEHYHFLIWLPKQVRVTDVLRDFKSMAGREILEWMLRKKLLGLRKRFALDGPAKRRRDARYCVLQYGNYIKELAGARILRQKIYYMHANPVRAGLVKRAEDYPFSSAMAYSGHGSTLVRVDHIEKTRPE